MDELIEALKWMDTPGSPQCIVLKDGTPVGRAALAEIERLRTALKRIRECGDVECDGVATDKVIYSADMHRQCRVIAHNALT